jgi:hypothetical protein
MLQSHVPMYPIISKVKIFMHTKAKFHLVKPRLKSFKIKANPIANIQFSFFFVSFSLMFFVLWV